MDETEKAMDTERTSLCCWQQFREILVGGNLAWRAAVLDFFVLTR